MQPPYCVSRRLSYCVVSQAGRFEKGMKVKVARTGRVVTLAAPQRMFANERRWGGGHES